ncbi:FeoB-associated Cys-rich membrane protein [Mycoplasmatota bacterium]|nr:FeoB-associated Cys-rich membrane protein [Mycoplasmatota bacterium]
MINYFLGAIILSSLILAVRKLIKDAKRGKCTGCPFRNKCNHNH